MNGHLDAEAHSAAVDGRDTADERAHLALCPACRAEVARLAEVARAVGSPVAPQPPSEAAAALLRALNAARAPGAAVPTRSGRRWLEPGKLWAAAAAVIVVVAGGAVLVRHATASHPHTAAVGGPSAAPGPRSAAGTASTLAPFPAGTDHRQSGTAPNPAAGAARLGPTGPVDGGDLGTQSAVGPLVAAVQAALDGEPTTTSIPAGEPALAQPTATCAAQAAAVSPVPLARLLYVATATWKGTPAIVLGEQGASQNGRPGPSRVLLVLARQGCGLLASQAF